MPKIIREVRVIREIRMTRGKADLRAGIDLS